MSTPLMATEFNGMKFVFLESKAFDELMSATWEVNRCEEVLTNRGFDHFILTPVGIFIYVRKRQ